MIPRTLEQTIRTRHQPGMATVVYGPRRVGKTTLLRALVGAGDNQNTVWFNGDTQETRDVLASTSLTQLKRAVGTATTIVVDEAQRITNIGLSLKILIDAFPDKRFLVTGSSSLSLAKGLREPLTGRTQVYRLFPLSTVELTANSASAPYTLDDQLLYGGYPYVWQLRQPTEKQDYLRTLVDDYLFRDLQELKEVGSPETLKKLTVLLAFQTGHEVSLNELAQQLMIDVKTVQRYLSLLADAFIIQPVSAYATNLRNEVSRSRKYYFWDVGIRNALIGQFAAMSLRSDRGQLWENFLAIERLKYQEYSRLFRQAYFWRTYAQAEVDWVEAEAESLQAYEFKWGNERVKTPKAFLKTYGVEVQPVSRENYVDFVSGKL